MNELMRKRILIHSLRESTNYRSSLVLTNIVTNLTFGELYADEILSQNKQLQLLATLVDISKLEDTLAFDINNSFNTLMVSQFLANDNHLVSNIHPDINQLLIKVIKDELIEAGITKEYVDKLAIDDKIKRYELKDMSELDRMKFYAEYSLIYGPISNLHILPLSINGVIIEKVHP